MSVVTATRELRLRTVSPVPTSTPPTARRSAAFRRDLQGLRAVAVLLVVSQHAGIGLVHGGYVGIDVFFVISGFLITGQLLGELARTGRISLTRFYARRMTRLLPAATLVVLGALIAAWHWMPPLTVKAISWDALAAAASAMNLRLAYQQTDQLTAQRDPSPLQHFWSLAIGEQFYLIWPLLLVCASLVWATRGRPSTRSAAVVLAMLCAGSLTLCLTLTTTDQAQASFGLHTRAWELGAGALVALGARKAARLGPVVAAAMTWTGLAAIVGAALVYTETTVFPGYAALLPVAGAVLMVGGGCARPPRGAEWVLRRRTFQELGRVSYAWYLWHWPILVLSPYVLGYQPGVAAKAALVLAALVPASMSLAAVEDPIRLHRMFRAGSARGLGLGLGLSACAGGVALLLLQASVPGPAGPVRTSSSDPVRLPALIRSSSTATSLPADLRPPLSDAPTDSPRHRNCIAPLEEPSISYHLRAGCEERGSGSGRSTVVLFGDSHAEQWFDALNVVALRRRWRLVVFTKVGCTAARGSVLRDKATSRYVECDLWRDEALKRIQRLRPATVVMSSSDRRAGPLGAGGDPDTAWAGAWRETVTLVRRSGAVPVVIQDTPFPGKNIPTCLSAHPSAVQTCGFGLPASLDAGRQEAIRRMGAATATRVITVAPWLCTATICPAVIGNTLVYRDGSHLTATYSKVLGGVLGRELDK